MGVMSHPVKYIKKISLIDILINFFSISIKIIICHFDYIAVSVECGLL